MPVLKKKKTKKNDKHPLLKNGKTRTASEAAADAMTEFLGSWTFIIVFSIFLLVWAGINLMAWKYRWDPYPFILLNLVLSTISAFQAPIIMMSQNRQTDRDIISANYDYAVNRKSER